jgi:clostripain
MQPLQMRQYCKNVILSIITLFFFSSCEKDSNEASSLLVRTVIVYMIADNNLDNFAVNDINEMEQGWNSELNGNLIVYLDRAGGAGVAHPVVYKITHDTTSDIVSPIAHVYKEQNSVDADIMYRVLSDIITDYAAENYGLILWSHGTGWLPVEQTAANQFNTISKRIIQRSFGRDNDREMNIFDLKEALPHHFDFIIFDACYMGAIEVIYELRDRANYILSSSTEILSAGYPYQDIVGKLFFPSINYSNVANTFFQSYLTLEGAMQSASVSVVKTSELSVLAEKVRAIMTCSRQEQHQIYY